MDKKRITVVGGDMRSIMLSKMLRADGNYVKTYGLELSEDREISDEFNMAEAIRDADIVIGPIPVTEDGENIRAPFHSKKISLKSIFETMGKGIFIAGRTGDISTMGAEYGVKVVDFLEREDMAVQNAIPTAEGAIQIAMEKTPITINGSNCLVLGYGRIGKILSRMLAALGANVYVAARKFADIAWIESQGKVAVKYNELRNELGNMDIIFNTVPCTVLGEAELKRVKADCLIIDLASKPGGVDFKCAERMGRNVYWALSLPGKVAPVSAATIMKNTIYNIIEETRVQNCYLMGCE